MTMRELIKLSGFILIIIGTAGLLLNEFVFDQSVAIARNRTIIFAVVSFVGFVNLVFSHFGMKKDKN